jgi:hypothetical protein
MNRILTRLPAPAAIAGVFMAASALAATPAHAEERLLILGADTLVVVDREVPCGQPVPLTVRASDAGLFSENNTRLQEIVDGSRAILSFECARMPALEITGELNAERGTLFQGHAGDDTGWLVQSSNWQPATPGPTSGDAGLESRAVAGLTLGMTRTEAGRTIASEFAGSAIRDGGSNRLVAGNSACLESLRSTAETQPGQRCLVADFGGPEQNRLVQVILHQSVDGNQRQDIRNSLLNRYGPPDDERSGNVRGSQSNRGEFVRLGWGNPLPEFTRPLGWPESLPDNRHTLDAYVANGGDTTELTIWLADPSSIPAEPEYRAKF